MSEALMAHSPPMHSAAAATGQQSPLPLDRLALSPSRSSLYDANHDSFSNDENNNKNNNNNDNSHQEDNNNNNNNNNEIKSSDANNSSRSRSSSSTSLVADDEGSDWPSTTLSSNTRLHIISPGSNNTVRKRKLAAANAAADANRQGETDAEGDADDAHHSNNNIAHAAASSSPSSDPLQKFGCCVFFFPTPVLSWLLPFSGHVAISNAEGTKLYTFESNYYVREERLADVLDRVLGSEADRRGSGNTASSSSDNEGTGLMSMSSDNDNTNNNNNRRSFKSSGYGSSSGGEGDGSSPRQHQRQARSAPQSPNSFVGTPLRRPHGNKTSAYSKYNNHAHTNCVRVWDLKPLLMEGRSVRQMARLASSGSVLWQKFIELSSHLDGMSGNNNNNNHNHTNPATSGEASSPDANSNSSLDCRYQLLDAPTARFFNRTLQTTISIFRGSPEGSTDVLQQRPHSSAFVGFVLEACGVGGAAVSASPGGPAENISWGPAKLLLNISIFGVWHRSERRVWRVMHGGTVIGSLLAWSVILVVVYAWFSRFFWPHAAIE